MMKMPHEKKLKIFYGCFVVSFFILATRLYSLQVLHRASYHQRSESNFVQERFIKHSRGKIFDSTGRILVDNRLAYDLFVTFSLLPDSLKSLQALATPLGANKKKIKALNDELIKLIEAGASEFVIAKELEKSRCVSIEEIARSQVIDGVNIYFDNNNQCTVKIDIEKFPSRRHMVKILADILKWDVESFIPIWTQADKKAQGLARFKPLFLISDIGFDAYVRIENAITLGILSGITVTPSTRRRYIYGNHAAHIIGFLNQVSIDDIKEGKGFYKGGDYKGRRGIEASYEELLRGRDGIERVVVDAKGRRFSEAWERDLLGDSRYQPSKSGASLRLSLDYYLQNAAQNFFLERSGSVVVLDVNTGFVLAMASFPSYDPNQIVSGGNAGYVRELMVDAMRPLRNKAVQDHYMPGSTFKAITGISGLKRGLISTATKKYCSGNFRIHKTWWRCFKREGHGHINLREALKASCDGYFYELGSELGLENLSMTAKLLGFGRPSGIDLLGEAPGLVPTIEYYRKRLGYVAPGFVVNMSIGQGDITVTPLQLAVAYAAISNGGNIYKPQLVSEVIDEDGKILKKFKPEVVSTISDVSYGLKDILDGLSFVAEPGGTAFSLRYKEDFKDISVWLRKNNIRLVGKTGTVQVVKLAKTIDHIDPEKVPYEHRDHAVYVGVFPKDNPEIAVVVVAEHAGFGSEKSAPAAARIMKVWDETYKRSDKDTALKEVKFGN